MKRKMFTCVLVIAATAAACKKKKEAPVTEPTPGSGSALTGSAPGSAADPAGSAAGEGSGSGAALPPGATAVKDYFKTPESVHYDIGRDNYLVANINGQPADADDNGFLVVVKDDGSAMKWIDGAADDIKLDAPKGTAISGDVLYVADITVVRRFAAKDGKQQDDIKIEGATFLNDVAADGKGGVYVTDSGLDAKFEGTGTDAVYHIAKDGKLTTVIKDKDLGKPNGVWPGANGSLWVSTFGSGELIEIDAKGKKVAAHKLPKGQLDGVVGLDDGTLLVSSWEGKAVYRGKPGGEWKEVVSNVESPADIAYDPKRKRVIIPLFTGDTVLMVPVE